MRWITVFVNALELITCFDWLFVSDNVWILFACFEGLGSVTIV